MNELKLIDEEARIRHEAEVERIRAEEERIRAEEERARARAARAEAKEQEARRTAVEIERDLALLSFLANPSEQNQSRLMQVLALIEEYRNTLA